MSVIMTDYENRLRAKAASSSCSKQYRLKLREMCGILVSIMDDWRAKAKTTNCHVDLFADMTKLAAKFA